MSNGFRVDAIPGIVRHGIENAYYNWYEMCDDWLGTAPEYLIVTHICRALERAIDLSKRSILLERNVHETIDEAGGSQPGRKAKALRGVNGRFDVVLGRANGTPIIPIEVKTRVWACSENAVYKDINRIIKALNSGFAHTKLKMGIFAFYTASEKPIRKDLTAIRKLRRLWETDFNKKLEHKYKNSGFRVRSRIAVHHGDAKYPDYAWGACTVVITRRRN